MSMKNIDIKTTIRFSSPEKRNQFNRLVRKAYSRYLPYCKENPHVAVHCAIWDTLQANRDLWSFGPVIESKNERFFSYARLEGLFEVLA